MAASITPTRFSSAVISAENGAATRSAIIPAHDYDLAATLTSGQAFRWTWRDGAWRGVLHDPAAPNQYRWVRLRQDRNAISADTIGPVTDWRWLTDYLQVDIDLDSILATFPDDEPLRAAVRACHGLRVLRQPPWECLASFILSSTKQIVQIQQIVGVLCERFGEPTPAPPEHSPCFAFPSADRLAQLTESDLRACKMGFRAPYLLATARGVAAGEVNLERLHGFPVETARAELMRLPGVGRKIADCVLLFAYGFPSVFPVDVWVMKALRQLYFPRRRVKPKRLRLFSETHFGPNAGYAQQYLFHYMRTKAR